MIFFFQTNLIDCYSLRLRLDNFIDLRFQRSMVVEESKNIIGYFQGFQTV